MTFHLTDTSAGVLSRQDSFSTITEANFGQPDLTTIPQSASSEHSPLLARAGSSGTPRDDDSDAGLPRPSTDSKRRQSTYFFALCSLSFGYRSLILLANRIRLDREAQSEFWNDLDEIRPARPILRACSRMDTKLSNVAVRTKKNSYLLTWRP